MKTICKKIYNLLEGTNGIIFIIYALFITLTQVYIHTVDDGAFWIGALIWLVICLLGCPFILRLVRNASFNEDKNCKFTIHNNVWRVVFFIVPLLVFLFH